MNLGIAIAITSEAFRDKTDKAGEPYILHCLRVMNHLHTKDKELQCIAVMHDLIEDTKWTIRHLIECGFSDRITNTLMFLTHNKSIPYMEYIKTISYNTDARLVKLADLKDNSNITRLKGLTKVDFDRMEKYHIAYTYLSKI